MSLVYWIVALGTRTLVPIAAVLRNVTQCDSRHIGLKHLGSMSVASKGLINSRVSNTRTY